MEGVNGLFRHILVPTDGSQPSNSAGKLAIQLALTHHATLTFIYVIDDSVVDKLTVSLGEKKEKIIRDLRYSGQKYLDYLVYLTHNTNLKSTQIICQGVPWNEISRLARKENVDLIVMGQIGRSGSRRLLIGPVAERVIEISPCPVLVVK